MHTATSMKSVGLLLVAAAAAACSASGLPASLLSAVGAGADTEVGWNTVPVDRYSLVARGKYNGSLYAMQISQGHYNASQPPLVVDLHGTHYQQGEDRTFCVWYFLFSPFTAQVMILACSR